MAINYSHLRSLTARELISALAETVLFWTAKRVRINSISILTGGGSRSHFTSR
jgi:hypothetical protein